MNWTRQIQWQTNQVIITILENVNTERKKTDNIGFYAMFIWKKKDLN